MSSEIIGNVPKPSPTWVDRQKKGNDLDITDDFFPSLGEVGGPSSSSFWGDMRSTSNKPSPRPPSASSPVGEQDLDIGIFEKGTYRHKT